CRSRRADTPPPPRPSLWLRPPPPRHPFVTNGWPDAGRPVATMAAMASPISIRLRAASPGLLALPWLDPLGERPREAAAFRDLNVGPSRHLVRFVEADYVLYALKELPSRIAEKEDRVLGGLQIG